MYLYYYILIGALHLSICYAGSASNYALSSQSYDRGDVSLSYKHNLIHIYTTSKPHHNHNSDQKHHNKSLPRNLPQLANYQNIQYAPLPLRPQEQQHSKQAITPEKELRKTEITEASTSAVQEIIEEIDSNKEQKSNLVPRVALIEPFNALPRKYVPGYNVDLQAVNNKLLQNGLYANNPNFLVKNKQVNVNYLQPQDTYHKKDDLEISQNNDAKVKSVNSGLTYQYFQDVKKDNVNIPPKDVTDEKRPFFYVKAPIVELNLARTYRIANAVHKASVNVNSSFRKLPSLPHEFFSNLKMLQPLKTQLYPVHNSYLYMIRRKA